MNILPIHFAPLQGYTEDCYRRAHHKLCGGIENYYTPFVRLEHHEIRGKDLRDVKPENNQGLPLVPQLIAKDADEVKALLSILKPFGYKHLDINMGCPFPLQTRHGRGAGIMTNPEQVKGICQIIQTMDEDIKFSVKMRLGLDNPRNWESILPILNDTPLEHITLHPRIATQQYKGDVDMEAFELFASQCKHPLIYNGDVTSIADIQQISMRFPQLKGIMIGRGLLARPTLAWEYQQGIILTEQELNLRIKQLHELLFADLQRIIPGETQLLQKVRTFWDFMEPTIGRKPWKKIHKAGSMRNYLKAIEEL